jgi:hypothetical protein
MDEPHHTTQPKTRLGEKMSKATSSRIWLERASVWIMSNKEAIDCFMSLSYSDPTETFYTALILFSSVWTRRISSMSMLVCEDATNASYMKCRLLPLVRYDVNRAKTTNLESLLSLTPICCGKWDFIEVEVLYLFWKGVEWWQLVRPPGVGLPTRARTLVLSHTKDL